MNKFLNCGLAAVVLLNSVGCTSMFTVGEEEFSCPGLPKGVICKGPREITEMTDNEETIQKYYESQALAEKAQQVKKEDDGFNIFLPWTWADDEEEEIIDGRPYLMNNRKGEVVYVRGGQITNAPTGVPTNPADAVNYQRRQIGAQAMSVAPNTQAVLEPAKVMRIYISPFEDNYGSLNMPGYVFVEIEKRKWVVGQQAQVNPARITPLQIRKRSITEAKESKPDVTNGLGVLMPKAQQ